MEVDRLNHDSRDDDTRDIRDAKRGVREGRQRVRRLITESVAALRDLAVDVVRSRWHYLLIDFLLVALVAVQLWRHVSKGDWSSRPPVADLEEMKLESSADGLPSFFAWPPASEPQASPPSPSSLITDSIHADFRPPKSHLSQSHQISPNVGSLVSTPASQQLRGKPALQTQPLILTPSETRKSEPSDDSSNLVASSGISDNATAGALDADVAVKLHSAVAGYDTASSDDDVLPSIAWVPRTPDLPLCWTSTSAEPTSSLQAAPEPAITQGGLSVYGSGCSTCTAGQTCTFFISVQSPGAMWTLPPVADATSNDSSSSSSSSTTTTTTATATASPFSYPSNGSMLSDSQPSAPPAATNSSVLSWWKRELALSLTGPSLLHVNPVCADPPACSRFVVAYRAWDAGTYRASLHAGCSNLLTTPSSSSSSSSSYSSPSYADVTHDVAAWTITILPSPHTLPPSTPPTSLNEAAATSRPSLNEATTSEDFTRRLLLLATAGQSSVGGEAASAEERFENSTLASHTPRYDSGNLKSTQTAANEEEREGNPSVAFQTLQAESATPGLPRVLEEITGESMIREEGEEDDEAQLSSRGGEKEGDGKKGSSSPCSGSVVGRWLEINPENDADSANAIASASTSGSRSSRGSKSSKRKDAWKWVPFSCAPPETPVSEWISSLTSRGIREISIAGDSHHRMLAAHLFYMLSGEADLRNRKGRHDLAFVARNGRNETLRINFYWVDGIYRNDEFGCTHRGAFSQHYDSFPNISLSSDVIIINSGYWAGKRCLHPLSALRTHLPEYLAWAQSQAVAAAAAPAAASYAAQASSAADAAAAAAAAAAATNLVDSSPSGSDPRGSGFASQSAAAAAAAAASLTTGAFPSPLSPAPSGASLRGNSAAALSRQSGATGGAERVERLLRGNLTSSTTTTVAATRGAVTRAEVTSTSRRVRLIVRAAPPVPNGGDSCSIASRIYEGPATNLFLSAANQLTRHLVNQINAGNSVPRIEYFDSWQVEAPRFMDVCPRDHHFHCYGSNGQGKVVMRGDVGEAVVSSAATDAKEASLDSSEWSLSDKLVAGRPAAVAGDATGSQERGSGAASDSHGRGQGESGDAGRHREGGAADGGKGSAKAKEKLEHVCYTSSAPWKGYHLVPRNHLPPGVVVGGRGCARCVRGRECGMRVWINAPATWVQIYPNASWWKKDMTLILKGPALSHGDVRCLDPPACSQLDLTYRLWDVGQYRAFLSVGCANLRFSPNYKQHLSQTHLHVLTSWNVTIVPQMRDAAWVNSSLALPPTSAAPFASSATDTATTATTTATATVTAVAAAVTAVATANVPPAATSAAATGTGEALNFGANSYNTNGNNKSVPASAVTSEISKHTISSSSSSSSSSVRRFLSGTWQEEEASEESETSRRRGTEGRGAEERRLLEGGASDEEEEEEEEEKLPMTPCQVSGIKGRWVLSKTSGFEWRFYPCSPKEPKRPSGWVAQLVRKGIQEINIVGDSHQRVLSFHLRYLLSGFADERMVRSHEDMNFTVTDERSGKQLRINFYWVDGIYRNREYGCS
ncbi:unnamed protein product, partial [Closterium sp. NIES-54]